MGKVIAISQDGEVFYPQIEVADNFWQRFCGLMGRKQLADGAGLLLKRCSSIHTCFMKFTIDVVYLDRNLKVLEYETIRPWKLGSLIKGVSHVLELPEGAGSQLKRGHPISLMLYSSVGEDNQ